ncbi:hypothetical protein QR680_018445 [Steinernema hermaphroditum]|uniref:Secreted protein n=1 Tax=Steinernema hermaphroditum TaxID=289476 RepID=A0AA39HK36_9BILA|nr:hypothetical protein QR680_018445 [Steinernema hermaphroditum]
MRVLIVLLIVAACYAAHKIRDQQFQIQGIEVYDEVSSRERRQVNQNYVRPSFGREAPQFAPRVVSDAFTPKLTQSFVISRRP